MKYMKKSLVMVFVFLLLVSFVNADLTGDCIIEPEGDCSTERSSVANLFFADETNSHVCFDTDGACYDYGLCCPGNNLDFRIVPIGGHISLTNIMNSHVSNTGVYSQKLSFFGAGHCGIKENSCNDGEHCVFSMSHENNAHVGECSDYDWKFCCRGSSNVYYLDITLDSSLCGGRFEDDTEAQDINVHVDEYVNNITRNSDGANVTIYFNGSNINHSVTDFNGNYTYSFSTSAVGNHSINITSIKEGFSPAYASCEFEVYSSNGVNPGNNPGGSGGATYSSYSDCYCPQGNDCSDGVGQMDEIQYEIVDGESSQIGIAVLECVLSEEDVPFFGIMSILMFLLIISGYYIKSKGEDNK